MSSILTTAQIIATVLLIIFILLQQRGTALGSAFGGGGEFYSARRGLQQKIYWATIISGIAFIVLAILNLYFK
jgi:protein translocase SecG subunit